uniref:WD40 repeat domain-containing protein n=1 Tax=Anaerolinea sp. TaxID=1872519 RepID=UPI002ACEE314
MLAVQRKKTDWQEADKVEVYRVQDGSLLDTVRGNGVLFSPDGLYLATVFDGSVRLYPAAELGQGWEKRLPKSTLPWCGGNERCGLIFSPDGLLAAVIRPSRVDVYRVEECKLVRQVSGWEGDGYALPQVQFADGQMLITTPALYDSQGNVRVKAQVIAVDVASGEWLSRSEVEKGFAYLDAGQVRTFRWQAEGEMPTMYHYNVSAGIVGNNQLNLYFFGGQDFGLVHCTYRGCSEQPFDPPIQEIPVYDENLEQYTLQFFPRWNLVHEDKKITLQYSGHSFAVPKAKIIRDLLVVWAADSPQSSEIVIFEKSTGKLLYRGGGFGFYSWGEKVYLFSQDYYVEIDNGKLEKHKSLEICSHLSRTAIALCTIFGGVRPQLDIVNMLDFVFVEGNFLVANYSNGFIRVWAVVPAGADVR